MNNSMNSRKNAARVERQQRKLDAGFIVAQFPEVASIVVSMMYNQRGYKNHYPGSSISFPAVMRCSG